MQIPIFREERMELMRSDWDTKVKMGDSFQVIFEHAHKSRGTWKEYLNKVEATILEGWRRVSDI